ncbi:hypothetical protein POTOM_030744 [Populus tomentosa]|uniref:Serine-threonine/tyrosine-protein kinase catalytic domain-containing protein n=1 Tax=Populus tomentosa TaxID=118781 RepID=A0A8X7ZHA3_POPTO|nr:hypothetical protein POTOM_030744 [Populus tomentosa]
MARIFGGDQKQANTNGVVTCGYMAPEHAMQGIFSVKSYVFGFGVLLLEIIAGKGRNGGFYLSDDGRLSLLSHTHGIYGIKAKQWRLWIQSWKKHAWNYFGMLLLELCTAVGKLVLYSFKTQDCSIKILKERHNEFQSPK